MRLYAFEGLRYTAKAGEPGALAAPPYDQIDDRLRDRLQALSPHQFTHLIKPVPEGDLDLYRHAAALHSRWLVEGTIERDPRPALYPYVIALAAGTGGGRRLGICGLAELADAKEIRPHEQTIEKPFADRLALLRATRVDLEPVFLLSEDGGHLNGVIEEDLAEISELTAPLVDHQDADGHHHLLYRIDDPQRIARYREILSGPAAIADGHHRYKVAQRFAEETGATLGTPAATKLAVVTSLDSPALTIDPIHRALTAAVDLERLAATAAAERRPFTGSGGAALAAAVAAAPQPALGVWVAGHEPEIWRLAPARATTPLPEGGRDLAVLLLHQLVFAALGLGPEAATDGTVIYRSDPDALYAMLAGSTAGSGFWLPPMEPAAFAAAIAHGDMLPPKSTRFLPKVMSGLVWADHGTRLL
jgi:uncharacterized protein (DUF1015 family)